MGSAKFTLNAGDLIKVLKNGLLVAIAAFLTYIANNLQAVDLGQYTALLIPIVALVLDTIVKWANDNTEQVVEPDNPEGE
jgi:hypothetical protein|tara:strand:+ start:257 stop:496 length:240 start_codon:yes stop_codon:yes gene_type:complete